MPLRALLGRTKQSLFYLAGRAQQIVDWFENHQFCGRCGSEMVLHPQDRAMTCESCRLVNYPRSVLYHRASHQGRRDVTGTKCELATNMYSTLAGFVEAGESIEQTVHREVFEEVGIKGEKFTVLRISELALPELIDVGFSCGI